MANIVLAHTTLHNGMLTFMAAATILMLDGELHFLC